MPDIKDPPYPWPDDTEPNWGGGGANFKEPAHVESKGKEEKRQQEDESRFLQLEAPAHLIAGSP
jgi:hypothetical protein